MRRPWARKLKPEERECVAFYDWVKLQRAFGQPLSNFVMHIPNERASKLTRLILNAMGVEKGVWDYLVAIPIPHGSAATGFECPGLWIEMKLAGKSGLTTSQIRFGDEMRAQGWQTAVARDAREASRYVETYLQRLVHRRQVHLRSHL